MIFTLLCWSENIKYLNTQFFEYLAKYLNTKHMVFVRTLIVVESQKQDQKLFIGQ